jgi:hypothetical protein
MPQRLLRLLRLLAWAWLCGLPLLALADGIPAAYAALVLQPRQDGAQAEFDLGPALDRARREQRRLYLYLGASDCPYCRRYEAFLARHAAELAPQFRRHGYLVVDLRSQLSTTADKLHFRIGAQRWGYKAFMQHLGDERERMLVYPSVWLLDTSPKPLMPMPAGTGTFETVAEQLEILRLEN